MIAHLDLDAFYAAVELHRRPELRARPLVVGGDPAGRGVVATASYEARRYGIRSAMSSAEALRRCPHAVVVRPDHAEYGRWSRRVWALVRGLAPTVEQVGVDEGYLVLPAGDPAEEAARVQSAVRRELRLSCSLGVATCKVVAKVASDMRKPGGITVVAPGEEAAFLAPLAVRRLPGVGPKAEERLRDAGIITIGGLAAVEDAALAALLPGRVGEELRRRARGVDPRAVSADPGEAVSYSTEETFVRDVAERGELDGHLLRMAASLGELLRRRGRVARTVTVKLRYPDFAIMTRSQTLAAATDEDDVIASAASRLLDAGLAARPAPVRLLGVGVSGLSRDRQLSLFAGGEPDRVAVPP